MRNRKRVYRWLVVLILAGILGGVGLMIYCAPSRGVTRKNFDKIQPGMTREEVEEILGVPQGRRGWNDYLQVYFDSSRLPPWESERIVIYVSFAAGRVESKEIHHISTRTWKARLTKWLPW